MCAEILVGTYGEDGALDETLDAISTRMEESNQTVRNAKRLRLLSSAVVDRLRAAQVMLKTIVVLHRVLRDGNAPAGHTSKLAKVMAQERSLPSHWTDATIITSYCRYIALRLSSTFLQGQEVSHLCIGVLPDSLVSSSLALRAVNRAVLTLPGRWSHWVTRRRDRRLGWTVPPLGHGRAP